MITLLILITFSLKGDDVTRDDSQQRFLAQHSVAILLRHCFEWLKHCSNIATLCYAKNRRCESSRLTSPLMIYWILLGENWCWLLLGENKKLVFITKLRFPINDDGGQI